MGFGFYPPGCQIRHTSDGEIMDVSGCDNPVWAAGAVYQSTSLSCDRQLVTGLTVHQIRELTGKDAPSPTGTMTITVWDQDVSWDDRGLTKGVTIIMEYGHPHNGKQPHHLPGVKRLSLPARHVYSINDAQFVASRSKILGYRTVHANPDGTLVNRNNKPSVPAGAIEHMRKKVEHTSNLEEELLENVVSSGFPVLTHDPAVNTTSLGVKVENFVYNNTKFGYMTGDIQESFFLVPDIILADRRSDGRGLIVEVDGFGHLPQYDDDCTRNRCLNQAGWEVIRVRMNGMNKVSPNDVVVHGNTIDPSSLNTLIHRITEFFSSTPTGEPVAPTVWEGVVYSGSGDTPHKSGLDQADASTDQVDQHPVSDSAEGQHNQDSVSPVVDPCTSPTNTNNSTANAIMVESITVCYGPVKSIFSSDYDAQ